MNAAVNLEKICNHNPFSDLILGQTHEKKLYSFKANQASF